MAAPATHIVLANKVFDKYFADKDKSAFLAGTSLPDIRYLGVIEREKTHFQVSKLAGVYDENVFIAGMRLHSLVDIVRADYMKKYDIYSYFEDSPFKTQAIKFFEDRILYGRVENWEEIIKIFDKLYDEENQFGIKIDNIKTWHQLLQNYLSSYPTNKQINIFVNGINEDKMAKEITHVLENTKDIKKVKEIIENFYNEFETLIF